MPGVQTAELVSAEETGKRLQHALGGDAALLDGVDPASLPESVEVTLAPGVRAAGMPVHDMWIRLTIDRKMNVIGAEACTDAMPYPPYCAGIAPDYAALAGLNLMRGFRMALHERFGLVRGCTHLTELLGQFPSAAIQVLAGEQRDNHDDGRKPFQLDRCHALDTGGEAVRLYYPRWRRVAKTGTD